MARKAPSEAWKSHVWKKRTYYVVVVQFSSANIPHNAILYSGFLNKDGSPGNYSGLFNPTYDGHYRPVEEAYSIKVVCEISEMATPPAAEQEGR